jgi:hypothetical protein
MPDNFAANPGSGGQTFASDEIAGIQFPRVKLSLGAPDSHEGDVSSVLPMPTRSVAVAEGGCSIFRRLDLDEAEQEVKAVGGTIYGMWFSNLSTSIRYLKFYNGTAASVTVGTSTPVLTIALPAATAGGVSGVFSIPQGINFGTAISVAVTTGPADNDVGAPGTGDVIVNLFYK